MTGEVLRADAECAGARPVRRDARRHEKARQWQRTRAGQDRGRHQDWAAGRDWWHRGSPPWRRAALAMARRHRALALSQPTAPAGAHLAAQPSGEILSMRSAPCDGLTLHIPSGARVGTGSPPGVAQLLRCGRTCGWNRCAATRAAVGQRRRSARVVLAVAGLTRAGRTARSARPSGRRDAAGRAGCACCRNAGLPTLRPPGVSGPAVESSTAADSGRSGERSLLATLAGRRGSHPLARTPPSPTGP